MLVVKWTFHLATEFKSENLVVSDNGPTAFTAIRELKKTFVHLHGTTLW